MSSIIFNCRITKQSSKVLREFVDDVKNPLYSEYKGFHTGVDLSGGSVFSTCPGVVALVGNNLKGRKVVIIAYDDRFMISYGNLTDVAVALGQSVDSDTFLGHCDKYVHVELLSSEKSRWPVRVYNSTFFKSDPTKLIEDGPSYLIDPRQIYAIQDEPEYIYVPDSAVDMLSNNKG